MESLNQSKAVTMLIGVYNLYAHIKNFKSMGMVLRCHSPTKHQAQRDYDEALADDFDAAAERLENDWRDTLGTHLVNVQNMGLAEISQYGNFDFPATDRNAALYKEREVQRINQIIRGIPDFDALGYGGRPNNIVNIPPVVEPFQWEDPVTKAWIVRAYLMDSIYDLFSSLNGAVDLTASFQNETCKDYLEYLHIYHCILVSDIVSRRLQETRAHLYDDERLREIYPGPSRTDFVNHVDAFLNGKEFYNAGANRPYIITAGDLSRLRFHSEVRHGLLRSRTTDNGLAVNAVNGADQGGNQGGQQVMFGDGAFLTGRLGQ
ncbi:hypothetical protein EJ03DRAFT_138966 [Teratosphaeria nubilosa]|uniref:Uncharacterized protein n=1 Tax=Teratosphaeria nubilosa TaxID=161662 RepID=A0A6G1L4M9_9PEZI|nr:hypothetical protein EJ03DRAFT_138966 [Teratosphaeria nubilosa]